MSAQNPWTRLLHDPGSVLTRDLLREPGGFGLGQVPKRVQPDATTAMICGFCGVGCSLDVHRKEGRAVNLSPSAAHPVNRGMACPKGWEALTPLAAPDRATQPLLRDAAGMLRPVDWGEAAQVFCTRMKALQAEHGADAVAFLGTGQIPFEEMAYLGAFAKFGMGTRHGDGNTRQCMATAVVAYKECFGFDAPPFTYADLEESDVLVFIGSNACIAHPILWEHVARNPHDPTLVVIDPRRTETAAQADWHLPLRPKGDLALLYAVAHVLIREGFLDRDFVEAHTEGFEGFAAHVASFDPASVERETGIPAADVERLAHLIHEGQRVSFWWTMGVNQSHQGVLTAQAIIALALMTGNIGRPGAGPCSITGQCNAMGSRLFSNTTCLFGGRSFGDAGHRAEIAELMDMDVERIPTDSGYAYDQIMEGILDGEIRGLWVVATNGAHSWINQRDARAILDKLDFLVVQDMYASTETCAHADLVLPAAGWGEKEGCFINSERRLGVIKQVARAPGKALSDFRIVRLLADAWGCGDLFGAWKTPADVFQVLRESTRGRPCDITGLADYEAIDALRGAQWPVPAGTQLEVASERRLFEDGRFYTPSGRARFCFGPSRPPADATSPRFPLVLLTGRGTSSQFHTMTRTGKSAVLARLHPREPYVELSTADARALAVDDHAWVVVESPRGKVRVRAFVTTTVPEGSCFMSMHFAETNELTNPSFDPKSREPSYKHCAVSVSRASG